MFFKGRCPLYFFSAVINTVTKKQNKQTNKRKPAGEERADFGVCFTAHLRKECCEKLKQRPQRVPLSRSCSTSFLYTAQNRQLGNDAARSGLGPLTPTSSHDSLSPTDVSTNNRTRATLQPQLPAGAALATRPLPLPARRSARVIGGTPATLAKRKHGGCRWRQSSRLKRKLGVCRR